MANTFITYDHLAPVLIENNIGVWEWDIDADQISWSDNIFKIFGVDHDFVPNFSKYLQSIHPDDLKPTEQKINEARGNGKNFTLEHRIITPNGEERWIECTGKLITKSNRSFLSGTVRDITERKTTELKLHYRDRLFFALSQATRELIVNPNWEEAILNSIKLLGEGTLVDRVYIFENDPVATDETPTTSQRYEWNSGAALPQIDNPELQHLPFSFIEPCIQPLSINQPFERIVRTMEEGSMKKILQDEDILSILIFPIFIRDHFWGFIGFDECKHERAWSEVEHSALRSFSATLSGSLERLMSEKGLKASEESYRGLFDTVGEAIYILDKYGRFLDVNQRVCEMFGYEKSEIIGRTPEFLAAEERNDLSQIKEILDLAYNGAPQALEWWGKRKDGRVFLKEVRLTKGHYFGLDVLIATGWDITDRKRVEDALRESEYRFRTLQQASYGGIGLHDQGIIIDCNQGLCQITGYRYEELIGMNGVELIAPEWRKLVRENIKQGYDKPYDVEGLRKDGSRYFLEVHGKNIPFKGRTIRVTEFRDISGRKQIEEKIREQNTRLLSITEDLKRKNEQLEEFTQIVSHNLRSPVGNIVTLLKLFEETTNERDRTEFFRLLKESGNITMRTLNELTDILKIQQNKNIERQTLRFESVMHDVQKMLHASISEVSATIHIDFSEAPEIHYPNIYLESILLNLLSNALKYYSPKRKPEISFKTYKLNGAILLTVSDNGLGIDLEKYSHQIFKLRKTFHAHAESRGIGLFMVKNQIEAMGGEIIIESKVDVGTTFTINFNKFANLKEEVTNYEKHAGGGVG